jgi:hypothetical protein
MGCGVRASFLLIGSVLFAGPILAAQIADATVPGTIVSEGTPPKDDVSKYPVYAAVGEISIGAEYLVHSFSGQNRTFVAPDYLVIEVAVYPPKGEKLKLASGQFTLRVNGKKRGLFSQPPYFVAASLKYPDWERRPTMTAGAGIGDTGVILGRPPVTGRFPGDPRPTQDRLPRPPRAPQTDQSGMDTPEPVRAEEIVVRAALPEGEISYPASGYLYFPYKKKPKSIKSLELIYNGPAGAATLPLF